MTAKELLEKLIGEGLPPEGWGRWVWKEEGGGYGLLGEMWVDLPEGKDYPSEEELRKLRAKLRSLAKQEAKEEKPQAKPQGQPQAQAQPKPQEDKKAKELKERLHKGDALISELIAKLKDKGLGAEAARLVAASGYKIAEDLEGKSVKELEALVEKARELYVALQGLDK